MFLSNIDLFIPQNLFFSLKSLAEEFVFSIKVIWRH